MKKESWTTQQQKERGLEINTRDTMPFSVATDLLCSPGRRTTNQERKEYQNARQRIFVSTGLKKPRALKLEEKMRGASLEQLNKWRLRAYKKRRGVQRKYGACIQLAENTPWRAGLIARLDFAASLLDSFTDAAVDETERRA